MKKKWAVAAVALLLAGLWCWRYISMNAYYRSLSDQHREIFPAGEIVPFGTDYIDKDMCVDGYSIRVDGFEIMEGKPYLDSLGITVHGDAPGKIALVSVTLFNDDSDAQGVMLTALRLHGVDQYAGMNWGLLTILNPVLKGNYGIHLSSGTEYKLVLPFDLRRAEYGVSTWNKLDEYTFYLRITNFPTDKDIQVQ